MINQQEYQHRRQQFFAQMSPNSVAVIPTAPEYLRSADQFYKFFPDNDFYYLTGFVEPEAVAVLVKSDQEGERYILFNRTHDEHAAVWVGERVGQQGAVTDYLADEAYPIDELESKLSEFIQDKDKLYYTFGRYQEFDTVLNHIVNKVREHVRGGVKIPDAVFNAENILFEMRLIKSEAEQAAMRRAAQISAQAHIRAMKNCRPGMNEYELQAEIVYEFLRQGCSEEAYGTIVGGGANACVLHYEINHDELKDGDLVLIDAGGRYKRYSSDITRTFPINGKFTEEQRLLYEVVLHAQKKAIETLKEGNRWCDMRDAAAYALTEGLVELKILKGNVQALCDNEAYRPFYMHRIGHWLGLDVHDVGRYKLHGEWREFKAGMVTTVEPGIYIKPGTKDVHKKWWGIGIRIEDDVIVTKDGHEVMSADVPKSVEDIEALMAS